MGQLARVGVRACQVLEAKGDDRHETGKVGVSVGSLEAELVGEAGEEKLQHDEATHDPLPGDGLKVPLLQHDVQQVVQPLEPGATPAYILPHLHSHSNK